jgi:dolichol-phosphate hexosyltransferase
MPIDERKIAVCLPTYNEAENVEFMVSSIREVFNGMLFIVDGYSTDDTVEIAKQYNVDVFYRNNPGKGSAMQKALEVADKAGKEFVVFIDCDRSNNPKDIKSLINFNETVDLVLGVRDFKKIKPIERLWGNIFTTGLINIFHGSNIKDSMTGMKLLRVNKFLTTLNEESFFVDPLICILAIRDNMYIEQIFVEHFERTGKSKMSFIKGLVLIPRFLNTLIFKK